MGRQCAQKREEPAQTDPYVVSLSLLYISQFELSRQLVSIPIREILATTIGHLIFQRSIDRVIDGESKRFRPGHSRFCVFEEAQYRSRFNRAFPVLQSAEIYRRSEILHSHLGVPLLEMYYTLIHAALFQIYWGQFKRFSRMLPA